MRLMLTLLALASLMIPSADAQVGQQGTGRGQSTVSAPAGPAVPPPNPPPEPGFDKLGLDRNDDWKDPVTCTLITNKGAKLKNGAIEFDHKGGALHLKINAKNAVLCIREGTGGNGLAHVKIIGSGNTIDCHTSGTTIEITGSNNMTEVAGDGNTANVGGTNNNTAIDQQTDDDPATPGVDETDPSDGNSLNLPNPTGDNTWNPNHSVGAPTQNPLGTGNTVKIGDKIAGAWY